jgi:GTP-binding protein EngB required for normal cell division
VTHEGPSLRLQALAAAAGAPDLAAEAGRLAERVREQRFHVACVGQFKRGKSTLLNALVGQAILPTGVVPVTSVPTILRHGQLGARVRTREGWTAISPGEVGQFVTEKHNPGNVKQVLSVEVLLPAPVLDHGLCFIDTPGLGSVYQTNTAATRDVVPHIDAALIVLGADPPLSGEELGLVETITGEVKTLLFVLNKMDRVSEGESRQAVEFLRGILADRLGLVPDRVYRIVAAGAGGGPDWAELVENLAELAQAQGEALVEAAGRRGIARIGAALLEWVVERRSILTRPVEEAERRAGELSRLQADADQALRELNPLFGAEEDALCHRFADQAEQFRIEARTRGLAMLRSEWAEGRFERAPPARYLESANRVARGLIQPWAERADAEAEAVYRETANRFTALANERLAKLAAAVPVGGGERPHIVAEPEGFRLRRHFAFDDRMRHYAPSPWPGVIDRVVPASIRRRRRQRRAEAYLDDLLAVNTSRVAGDLAERVRESRREEQSEIRESLLRVSRAATSALGWAREVRARGVDAVRREADRLDELAGEVARLLGAVRNDPVPPTPATVGGQAASAVHGAPMTPG